VGLQPLNGWRNGDAGGLEGRGAVAANIRPQQEVLILVDDFGQPQGLEVADHSGPLDPLSPIFDPPQQFGAQQESEKAAEDVPADRLVALVVDGPRLEHRLSGPVHVLDHPEFLVLERDVLRGEVGAVGLDHPLAVVPLFATDLGFVDLKAGAAAREEAAVSAIADECLVPLLQLLPERRHDRIR